MRYLNPSVLLLSLAVGAPACNSNRGAPSAAPVFAAADIGAAGGIAAAPSGRVSVVIPPGAVPGGVLQVTIEGFPKDGFPDSGSLVTDVFEFTPDGALFDLPVTVAIELPAGTQGVLATLNAAGDAWEPIPLSTQVGDMVIGQTRHFSFYSVITPAAAPTGCSFRAEIPIVKPHILKVAPATKTDSLVVAALGSEGIELSSTWIANTRFVTVTGLAGPPSGEGAWIDWSTMSGGTFDIDPATGTFSLTFDLETQGPYFALTDACNAPFADETNGWAYTLEIDCGPECAATIPPPAPLCNFPETGTLAPVSSFQQLALDFDPGVSCGLGSTGIFVFRRYPGGTVTFGERTVTAVAGINRWKIHSITHGTLISADQAYFLPDATDITMTISPVASSTPTHTLVFRFDGGDLTAVSLQ